MSDESLKLPESARDPLLTRVPWSRGATWAIVLGTLTLFALYGIGIGVASMAPSRDWIHSAQIAYGTTAFFSLFAFAGFIVGLCSAARPYRNATVALVLCLAPLVLARLEGLVCILMSLPLIVPEVLFGAWLGFRIRKWAYLNERRRLGLVVLAFCLSAGWELQAARDNDPSLHPVHRVETALSMRAPPDRVFAALMDIEVTRAPPGWLRIGLPIPRRMRVVRPGLDGTIRFDYADMAVDAQITAWEPGRRLAFRPTHYDIHDPPFFHTRLGSVPGLKHDPVTDWMTFEEMSYDLQALPGGGTRVTRTSVFRRHLFPDLYFGWLEPLVIAKGQAHLLEGIRDVVDGNGQLLSLGSR